MSLDTVAGLFDRIQLNLGRGAQTTIATMIPDWVNLTQREICTQGKWWFTLEEDTTQTLSTSTDTITLPSNFVDDEYLFLKDSDGIITEVELMEPMEFRQSYTDQTGATYEGLPRHYMLRDTDALVRPIANEAYTVLLGYWKFLTDLVTGGTTNELLVNYPDILEYGATSKGFQYMQEYEDAQYWKGKYDEQLKELKASNADRMFPGEMVLSIRPGQKGNRLGRRIGISSRRNY